MLLIQDIHQVIGRSEVPFEESYRDELVPALAENGDASLVFFGWLPHGGGEGYEAVTLTAVTDVDALDRHQERLRRGDLTSWWTSVEAKRYTLTSSLQLTSDEGAAALRPSTGPAVAGAGGLFRLDSGVAAGDAAAVAGAITAQLGPGSDADACRLVACWSPFFGALAGSTVHVLYRITDHVRLAEALEADAATHRWSGTADPAHFAGGGPQRHRLVRAAGWSPLR
jgi:hypothetical protein